MFPVDEIKTRYRMQFDVNSAWGQAKDTASIFDNESDLGSF